MDKLCRFQNIKNILFLKADSDVFYMTADLRKEKCERLQKSFLKILLFKISRHLLCE